MRSHIKHSVTIDQPHDSWLGMTNDATCESSDSAFLNDDRVWLAGKDWSLLGLVLLVRLLWHTVEQTKEYMCFDSTLINFILHLPGGLHFSDALDTLHALWQLRFVDDSWFASGFNDRPSLIHAVEIGGTAQVLATVLRVYPAKVHGHIAKVIDRIEAIFL